MWRHWQAHKSAIYSTRFDPAHTKSMRLQVTGMYKATLISRLLLYYQIFVLLILTSFLSCFFFFSHPLTRNSFFSFTSLKLIILIIDVTYILQLLS